MRGVHVVSLSDRASPQELRGYIARQRDIGGQLQASLDVDVLSNVWREVIIPSVTLEESASTQQQEPLCVVEMAPLRLNTSAGMATWKALIAGWWETCSEK